MHHDDAISEDGLQDYLKQVGSHRLLNREEEVELFQSLESGNEAAFDEIVRCNIRLVVKIAMQFRGMGMPVADLVQEGTVGLLHVVRKFDWKKGFRFSTYAAFWIRQEIQAAVRNSGSMIRLPIRKSRMMGKIGEAIRNFSFMEGRDPSIEEIAFCLGEDTEKIAALMPWRESMVSLDAARTDDGANLFEAIPHDAPLPSARLSDQQAATTVRAALSHLTERERNVIDLRFGLTDGRCLSLRKTSRVVGLSQEGVRRIERRAIGKLQRPAIMAGLDGLLTA